MVIQTECEIREDDSVICSECNNEKEIERVNILVYKKPVCQDCVDHDQNMKLARIAKERFERFDEFEKARYNTNNLNK